MTKFEQDVSNYVRHYLGQSPKPMNTTPKQKNPAAVALGRLGGRKRGCKGRPLSPDKARAMVAIREANKILRHNLAEAGIADPSPYEWLDGEAWYRGEPIQARATSNEQTAINKTIQQLNKTP